MYCSKCGKIMENDEQVCSCITQEENISESQFQETQQKIIQEPVLSPVQKHSSVFAWISTAFIAIVLLCSSIPFIHDLLISMKEYSVFRGILNSPFCGLVNYQHFFESPYFSRLFINAVVQNILCSFFIFSLSSM